MYDLQPIRSFLTFRTVISLAYKHENHSTRAQVAKYQSKFLQKAPQGSAYTKFEFIKNAKIIFKNCEQLSNHEYFIDFEENYLVKCYKINFSDILSICQGQSNNNLCLLGKEINFEKIFYL
ncbi:unnamed protein product [Paramecium sonneborni]|uniref:Uncharacterized protein n=1 Tax=Paramecium sonneborni TaxID=65129 RepID=A0A8S1LJS3_9CILI|nr:unnamed protein product [Paramecium sonneborni]